MRFLPVIIVWSGVVLLLGTQPLVAQQMMLTPLEHNSQLLEYAHTHPRSAARNYQVCPLDTLALPFFDDFADRDSMYPDCKKWQDNHVFINGDMAYNPPSVGVATFEGLQWNGAPYDPGASLGTAHPADTLTSQALDLAGKTTADAIYLSFFYQPQGLADRPEVQDSFLLEFKNISGQWVRVWQVGGLGSSISAFQLTPFKQQYIAIDNADYLYRGFQFRFRNLATITGNNDHWHLDYVFIDENRANNANPTHSTYGSSADVAFTHRPQTPLKDGLTAMPWRHFRAATQKWASDVMLEQSNHNHSQVATLDREVVVEEIAPNNTLLLTEPIPAVGAYGPSPNTNDSLKHRLINSFSPLLPNEKTVIKTTQVILNPFGFQSNPIYNSNDTVTRETVLSNYFAYDDGTAEVRVIAQGLGTKIAVEFVAEIEDTLQGVYFHLPYFRDVANQGEFVNVKVWLDSLGDRTEVFSRDLHRLQYRWGYNGFYFVDMLDFAGNKFLIPIKKGQKFYVGWQQSFGPEVPVGFDRSTDNSDKTWVGVGNTWTQSTLKGSVMIRPLLSPNPNFNLISIPQLPSKNTQPLLTIYPNPVQSLIHLDLQKKYDTPAYQVVVHDIMGRTIYQNAFETTIDASQWQAGYYILTLQDEQGQLISQHKLIKHP